MARDERFVCQRLEPNCGCPAVRNCPSSLMALAAGIFVKYPAPPTLGPMSVTFALNGYQPDTETIEPIANNVGYPEMRPNPVQVELTPAPPPPKPIKKPVARKRTKPKPKPKTSAAPPPATAAPPAAQQAPAPWPTNPPPAR